MNKLKFILTLAIFAVVLSFNASASGLFGGDTDNSISNSATSGVRDSGNSRNTNVNTAIASGGDAHQRQSQGQGQDQGQLQGQLQGNVGINKAVGTGNETSVTIGGDTFEAPASGGSISNSVAYDCGGTAGGYAHFPGASLGGGAAFAFELCEDIYVARVAVEYGVPGAEEFLLSILQRRVKEFNQRGVVANVVTPAWMQR